MPRTVGINAGETILNSPCAVQVLFVYIRIRHTDFSQLFGRKSHRRSTEGALCIVRVPPTVAETVIFHVNISDINCKVSFLSILWKVFRISADVEGKAKVSLENNSFQ